jgi:hypothetical protein
MRGQRLPFMASKLSRLAIACCLKPPHELDRPSRFASKLRAAAWRDCPAKTARTMRSRKSREYGFAIHAGLLSSRRGETSFGRFGNPLPILPNRDMLVL